MASSDSDDDDGDYGLSVDAAAALLVRVQRRPVVRHPEYPHGPDGAHCGTTADGDALLCARGNGMRALESASLSAVLCGLPSLSAAVRLAGMCAGSGNPLWLWPYCRESVWLQPTDAQTLTRGLPITAWEASVEHLNIALWLLQPWYQILAIQMPLCR